jgi:hypothetical protein
VRQHLMVIFELDLEHGVRKGFEDHAFQHDRIFLWLWQGLLLLDFFALPSAVSAQRVDLFGALFYGLA